MPLRVLHRLLRRRHPAEQADQQFVVVHVLELEEQIAAVLEAIAVANEQVVVGKAADHVMAATPHRQVNDETVLNARPPASMDRVGKSDRGLDEVGVWVSKGRGGTTGKCSGR